ncbi:hypothetical protein [Halorubrum sp. BOL3-1]|uniref:hypothetical protein n=1 Tax=Halorubrum sp. BOL3-1 TaxID=2497325 RepID=UPI001F4F85C3|nr:hypothetical protein [Halorubrum sp. BOL3-1]
MSFTDSSVTVFRKSREWKEASLPEPVITPLKRYAEVLDVPESWPVFTTLHRPSLASHVSTGLSDAGLDDDEIERVRAGAHDLIVAAEHDLDAPKPLTTDGARSIMERIWTHETARHDQETAYRRNLVDHNRQRVIECVSHLLRSGFDCFISHLSQENSALLKSDLISRYHRFRRVKPRKSNLPWRSTSSTSLSSVVT